MNYRATKTYTQPQFLELEVRKLLDFSLPFTNTSLNYKHWITVEDLKRCLICTINHGKIWTTDETPYPEPPIHPYCRCVIKLMESITAGNATFNGANGADWTLKNCHTLPDYYISMRDLISLGWKKGKSPAFFAKGKMMTKGIYNNINGHLPQKEGRVWCEADINYIQGKRNSHRILWSNDGLIFVTYDHYQTFYEIV